MATQEKTLTERVIITIGTPIITYILCRVILWAMFTVLGLYKMLGESAGAVVHLARRGNGFIRLLARPDRATEKVRHRKGQHHQQDRAQNQRKRLHHRDPYARCSPHSPNQPVSGCADFRGSRSGQKPQFD